MITTDDVKQRLIELGINVSDAEDGLIGYIATSKEQYIKNTCNIIEIPEELSNKAIDMVCSEYLITKKGSGADIGIDISSAVSSVSEGDTSVTVSKDMKTPEQRLDELIAVLGNEDELLSYRKLSW